MAVDLFLDILIDLDSYIISRNVQLTTEELRRSNELKDAMRESCIGSLIHTCYQLIVSYNLRFAFLSSLSTESQPHYNQITTRYSFVVFLFNHLNISQLLTQIDHIDKTVIG